jgi:flagellar basal-body rod protein FlgB
MANSQGRAILMPASARVQVIRAAADTADSPAFAAAVPCREPVTCVTPANALAPIYGRCRPPGARWHVTCFGPPQDRFLTEQFVAMDLDAYLGVHAAALKLHERRTALLATNLANADTPGFKARDLDFRSALAAAGSPSGRHLVATRPGHIGTAASAAAGDGPGSTEAFLKYRTPLAPSLDGNTVDAQLEQAAFAENAVRYQATLSFLSSRFRSLMTAITGQ